MTQPPCGICHSHSRDSPLMCAACANFILLRPRIEYLEVLGESSEVKGMVDQVLGKCIKGQNLQFVEEYITKQKQLGDDPAPLPVASGKNVNKALSPSEDSIAALSSQLLTIDALIIKRKTTKIQREINLVRSKKEIASQKLASLRKEAQERRSQLELRRMGQRETQDKIKTWKNEILYKDQDNKNLIKQINNSRSLLFQELINIYIIKKRKISGTTRSVFMLSFTPILSTSNLAEFSTQLINACLERMCKFIHQVSKVLLVSLPYSIVFNRDVFYKPKILSYELFLKDDQQVWSLSESELKSLVNGITMLIIDVHYVLKFLELDEEIKSYSDLLRLDSMIFKLAYNDYSFNKPDSDDGSGGGGGGGGVSASSRLRSVTPVALPQDEVLSSVDVDVDKLATMMFEVVNKRVNTKNNDWHFVKKEYLVDDD